MLRICVFTGSSPGARTDYADAARALGRELVDRGHELVYGGSTAGLMGILADEVLGAGGHVIGVMPEALVAKEVAHRGLPDLRVVGTMHERKALMADLSDAFIALPGGFGTLDEFFEALTWSQLGLHAKACGMLNVCGYFDGLLAFLDRAVEERFLPGPHRAMIISGDSPQALLASLATCSPPTVEKWMDREGS